MKGSGHGASGSADGARSPASIVLAAVLAAAAALSLWWRSPSLRCGDFCSYYAAGSLALAGDPAAAFDSTLLEKRHREIHDLKQRAGPFLYSPLLLPPSALFARVPLATAQAANRAFGALALGAGLWALLVALDGVALRVAVAAAFALAHVAWVQLVYANWSFLLFALLAAAGLALARGRPILAACAAAAAIHLKAFSLFAIAGLVAGPKRRIVAWTAGAAALLLALSLATTGVEPWRRFTTFLGGTADAGVRPFYSKCSLAANLARLASEPREWVVAHKPVETIPVRAAFWAGLPLLVYGSWRLRARPPASFAFGIAWFLLFVPQVWEHTEILIFLTLPALGRRCQWLFVALLAATFFYNGTQQDLLREVARGERPASVLAAFLWIYPALNLAAMAAVLSGRNGARGSAGPARATAVDRARAS